MLPHLSLFALATLFLAASAAIWFAGIRLSKAADVLSVRLNMGEAFGGLILLAMATNLPEIAIVASASWRGDISIAIGNIFGGIAIQTVVLVLLDIWGVKGPEPLSSKAAGLDLVLEGVLVVAVLIVAIMATRLPPELFIARVAPGGALIAAIWIAGLWLIGQSREALPWTASPDAAAGQEAPRGHKQKQTSDAHKGGLGRAALVFALAALVTLLAGVVLEQSGQVIAAKIGMTGVLFGATVLAAATALPEVSTGLASVKLGDFKMAVSDIFGGNAFLPVLFLLSSLISGKAALPQAQDSDVYLAALGVLLTCVYLYGLVFRPRRKLVGMGVDSLVVLGFYAVGMLGLVFIAQAKH